MRTIQILPSLLAADFAELGTACKCVADSGADALHLDIMDGHFVPNLSFSPDTAAMAKRSLPRDFKINTHLMVANPDFFAPLFLKAGSTTIQFHIEVKPDVKKLAEIIHAAGARVGLALNPDVPADAVLPYLEYVDEILCMTVFPGYGGQAFMPEVLPKIAKIRAATPDKDIMVDGGINLETAVLSARAGANQFVAGSYLFKQKNMTDAISELRTAIVEASALNG